LPLPCLFPPSQVLLGENVLSGCEVNGAGKAKEAAIGLARGDYAVIFREEKIVKRVKMSEAASKLLEEIQCFTSNS